MGIGVWGLGIGDWGLGPIPNPQSPIPNPHVKNINDLLFLEAYFLVHSLAFLLNSFISVLYSSALIKSKELEGT